MTVLDSLGLPLYLLSLLGVLIDIELFVTSTRHTFASCSINFQSLITSQGLRQN